MKLLSLRAKFRCCCRRRASGRRREKRGTRKTKTSPIKPFSYFSLDLLVHAPAACFISPRRWRLPQFIPPDITIKFRNLTNSLGRGEKHSRCRHVHGRPLDCYCVRGVTLSWNPKCGLACDSLRRRSLRGIETDDASLASTSSSPVFPDTDLK